MEHLVFLLEYFAPLVVLIQFNKLSDRPSRPVTFLRNPATPKRRFASSHQSCIRDSDSPVQTAAFFIVDYLKIVDALTSLRSSKNI